MAAQLPGWWTTPSLWVDLLVMLVAFAAACRAAMVMHRRGLIGFAYQFLAVATLAAGWVSALALRVLGVIDQQTYLDLVGPLGTMGRVLVWTVPSLTAVNWVRRRPLAERGVP